MIALRRRVVALCIGILLASLASPLAPTVAAACARTGGDGTPGVSVGGCNPCQIWDGGMGRYNRPCHDPLPDRARLCLTIDLSLDAHDAAGGRRDVHVDNSTLGGVRGKLTCGPSSPDVALRWRATASGGSGNATFAFDPLDVAYSLRSAGVVARPLSPLSALAGFLARPQASHVEFLDASVEPRDDWTPTERPRVVVTVAFDLAWGGDCEDAHGTLSATVHAPGARADARVQDPSPFFRELCLLGKAPDATALAPDAVAAAATLARELAGAVPFPGFHDIPAALALLVPELRASTPTPLEGGHEAAGVAVGPGDGGDEARSAGDAMVALAGSDAIVAEEHEVELSMPLAQGATHGNASLAFSTGPRVASAPADPPASPAQGAAPAAGGAPRPGVLPPPVAGALPGRPLDAPRDAGEGPPLARLSGRAVSLELDGGRAFAGLAGAATMAALLLAAYALYQRVAGPPATQHAGRAALLRACQASLQGATAGKLAAATGMTRKTAEYHLYYLARRGHLRMERGRDGVRRFSAHSAPRRDPPEGEQLEDVVLARIVARPGASTSELSRELGVSRLRVDRRVKDLLVEGLVTSRMEEGSRRLYPA